MTSFLIYFSASRQCPRQAPFFLLFPVFPYRKRFLTHKILCLLLASFTIKPISTALRFLPSSVPAAATKISVFQSDPVFRSYSRTGISLQPHPHSVPRPPPAIFHRAIHTALYLKCTACLFHSIVPDTFLRDPPESLPRYTFLPLSSALLYNFPLLHYCHAGIDTTQVSYVCRFLSTTFDFYLIVKLFYPEGKK